MGSSVRGTISNNASKCSRESGERSDGEGGDQDKGTADSSGHSKIPQNANIKQFLKTVDNKRGEKVIRLRSLSQRAPQSDIFVASHGTFHDNVPVTPPLGQLHTEMEPYSKMTHKWAMRLRVAPLPRDNGFIKSLQNVRMFLQISKITRNNRLNLYLKKESEPMYMLNIACS